MPRWPAWFRRVGDTANHPDGVDAGRKLLGLMNARMAAPGTQTLTQRITLDDGTQVEASFIGGQPQVVVRAPDLKEACELYVESGMLDLGPNIAGDAGARFNRGDPQFDSRPATLWFGDDVGCAQGTPGLNGRVRIDMRTRQITSECLPRFGKSIQSKLRDPIKKQAQAMLPASCWSGLMQRYVQAIYGGQTVDYAASAGGLVVNGVKLGCTHAETTGLVRINNAYVFVTINGTSAKWYPIRFKTCGEAVMRAASAARKSGKKDLADKLLTIALSDAMPDKQRYGNVIGDFPAIVEISSYGWQFSPIEPVASVVGIDYPHHAVLLSARFSAFAGGIGAECTIDERVEMPTFDNACVFSHPANGDMVLSGGANYLAPGETIDHPVATWYDNEGRRVVVRYSVSARDPGPATIEAAECLNAQGFNEFDSIPNEIVDAPLSCHVTTYHPSLGPYAPVRRSPLTELAVGVYAKAMDSVLWSTVEMVPAVIAARQDGGTEEQCVTMRTGVSIGGFPQITYETRETTLTAAGGAIPATVMGADIRPPVVINNSLRGDDVCKIILHPAGRECTDAQCEAGECSQIALYSSPAMGITWQTLPNGCVTRANVETDPPHQPVVASSTVTCTHACRTINRRWAKGGLVIGKQSVVVQPRGDSRRIAVIDAHRRGITGAFGIPTYYEEETRGTVECESPVHGSCTGTVTIECAGGPFPGAPEKEHAPHSETVDYSFDKYGRTGYFKEMPEIGMFRHRRRAERIECIIDVLGFDGTYVRNLAEGSCVNQFEGYADYVIENTPELKFAGYVPADVPHIEFVGGGNCPTFSAFVSTNINDVPIRVMYPDGERRLEIELLNLTVQPKIFQNGFSYRVQSSLLGSVAYTPAGQMLKFGESVNMDRQAISGGYHKINTPSFVGWA